MQIIHKKNTHEAKKFRNLLLMHGKKPTDSLKSQLYRDSQVIKPLQANAQNFFFFIL